jgi:hypothetical protein
MTNTSVRIAFLLLVAAACGGGGGGDDIGPGDEDFTPPAESEGDGTSKPADATDTTCASSGDCAYWFCACADGAVVNSANCTNGWCMGAATACPDACASFEHGAWTGDAGGGPGQPVDDDPPAGGDCGGLGSADPTCDACYADECCGEGAACADNPSCLDYWDCAVGCGGDSLCRDDCDFLYPDGASDYASLEGCLLGACFDACS